MMTYGSIGMRFFGAAVLVLIAAFSMGRDARAAEVTLEIGTLFPKASPWGQVLETWAQAVNDKSGGRVELLFHYNGREGDEAAMVAKMKAGTLAGAAVSAVGLGKIYKPILALQMPGLFSSWAKLDAARNAMKGELEQGALDAGFLIVGWGDVGVVRFFSKGFALRTPDDFKGKKPFGWRDDDISSIFYQVAGGVTPVPLNIPEVLPNLNTGAINALHTSALSAEQFQWASKLDTIRADTFAFSIGAVVLSSKQLDLLPADLRNIVVDSGKVATAALTKRIRSEDAAAFTRLKGKMTVVTLTAAEQAKWGALYKQVRARLAQGTFSPDLVTRLEALAK